MLNCCCPFSSSLFFASVLPFFPFCFSFFFFFPLTVLLSLISDGDVVAKPVFALGAVAT